MFGVKSLKKVKNKKGVTMTNADIIEEILVESHYKGIRLDAIGYAETIMTNDPKLDKSTAYQKAYDELKKY